MASRDTPPADRRATKSAATRSLCPPPSCRRPNVVPVVSVGCPAKVAPTCHDAQYRPVFEKSRRGGVTQGHAMSPVVSIEQLAADLRAGVLFCTRLPVPGAATITGADIARAGWALPVAGVIVGLITALVYWLARVSGLPPLPAGGLAIAASLAATGCLHEDGLADVADSFGGRTRERKLEIMRDSRIGTYGVCVLFTSLLLRSVALASIADPGLAAPVLIAAHMGARSNMAMFMRLVPL